MSVKFFDRASRDSRPPEAGKRSCGREWTLGVACRSQTVECRWRAATPPCRKPSKQAIFGQEAWCLRHNRNGKPFATRLRNPPMQPDVYTALDIAAAARVPERLVVSLLARGEIRSLAAIAPTERPI